MGDMIDRDAALALEDGAGFVDANAIRALPAVTVGVPTEAQIASACLSYDHSFGLMDGPQRVAMMHQAREWLHAWRNEFAALEPVTQPAPDAAFASGFKAGLKAAAEHWFRGVSGVRQLLPETKAQILAIPCPPPAPTAQLDAGGVKEAWEKAYWRMRSYAVHDNDCKLNKPPRFDGPCSCGLTAALEEALALITEKPHDRA